ncbi:hypothetical protein [Schumannella sp. 10F1B-5-1]|uniref:hypothetical protein n=1 Tax=Schumannella sp. 10F1B-5-1 TaxID=2590780 RepID=UPI0011326047|nr:hypothetical protein [Schumannella sp. 10F1B-5-1]TPW72932.1 hypothetical protein FJ658_06660 [Schumannella sp. 10F1B-5-1]
MTATSSSSSTAPFAIEATLGGGVAIAVVRARAGAAREDRDALLTDGVFAVLEHINAATAEVPRGRSILDVRLADDLDSAHLPGTEAFVEAVRGLMQAHTLESGPEAPALTLLVSTEGQADARERTVAYLTGDHGDFSRGATYDLREVRP